jgi:hypothetical protein
LLLELVGQSLMYEERFFVGFLPLRSYFDAMKHVGSGKPCPEGKEDQVRATI